MDWLSFAISNFYLYNINIIEIIFSKISTLIVIWGGILNKIIIPLSLKSRKYMKITSFQMR